jgi:hypothetical protein
MEWIIGIGRFVLIVGLMVFLGLGAILPVGYCINAMIEIIDMMKEKFND